jgi:hypothetical protein
MAEQSSLTNMKKPLVPLIEKPCPVSWDKMEGDEKRRYCEVCRLHVHNLSEMSLKEQRDLLSQNQERVCVSYVAKPDAERVSADVWMRSTSFWRRAATFVFGGLAAMSGISCTSSATRETGMVPPKTVHESTTSADGKPMVGGLAPKPSFGQRLLGMLKLR